MPTKEQIAAESLDKALVTLMDKLGYGAEKLWTLYVQAQLAQAVASTITLVSVIMGVYLGYKAGGKASKSYNSRKKKEYEKSNWAEPEEVMEVFNIMAGKVMGVLLGILVGLILGDFIAYEIVLKVIAPEYTAAQELIQQLNTLT